MSSRLQQQPRGGEASRTQTEQGVQANGGGEIGTLRLRPPPATNGIAGPSQDPQPRRRRVVWSEGTVDNEGLGRKSSKICCIYHKPKAFDESSDSDSSSSGGDDSSDSESDSSGHVGADRRQPHSDSDASSGPETDGPNLSSSLRRKKAHQHQHDDSSACAKHKMKKSTSRRTRGSTTQTVTVQDTDLPDAGQQNGDGEDDTGDSRQPSKPNAYERGPR